MPFWRLLRSSTTLGILPPSKLGATIAASATAAVPRVLWAAAGRSRATVQRAGAAGWEDAGTLAQLVRASDVIVRIGRINGLVAPPAGRPPSSLCRRLGRAAQQPLRCAARAAWLGSRHG